MRRVFHVPARYAAEIDAAVTEAVERVTRDLEAPGHVAPFMLDPARTGLVRITIDTIAEVDAVSTADTSILQPRSA